MSRQTITDSEYELMKILWEADDPLTLGEILKKLPEHKWSRNTVSTLLSRLVDKGAASYEKRGKYNLYYAVIKEKDYSIKETKSFLSKMFGGSVKNMVASLYESREISREEIEDLRKMFNLEE